MSSLPFSIVYLHFCFLFFWTVGEGAGCLQTHHSFQSTGTHAAVIKTVSLGKERGFLTAFLMTDDVRQQLQSSDGSAQIDEQIGELVQRISYTAKYENCPIWILGLSWRCVSLQTPQEVPLFTWGLTEEHFVIHTDIRVKTCSLPKRGGACFVPPEVHLNVEGRVCMASVTAAHQHCWRDGEVKKIDYRELFIYQHTK